MNSIEERRGERKKWSDERLTLELASAAAGERGSLVELLLDLVEFDHRSLSQKGSYPTLFAYCTRKLGYSSSEAGRRIAVARKTEKLPLLLETIERGELHLSGAAMLTGLLTPENHEEVLRRAKGRTQDEIARLVAALAPKPAPRDRIRPLSAPVESAGLVPRLPAAALPALAAPVIATPVIAAPAAIPAALPAAPASIPAQPAAAELYLVSFCATRETQDLIERAKEVLRHRFPKGGLDEIVNLALKTLLTRVDRDLRKPRRAGRAPAKDKRTRYVPEAVKQESWERAGGRCAYVSPDGTQCTSRAWLEFDHIVPYALGGSSVDAANIRLYCRPHNAWAATQIFGPWQGGQMKPQNTS